MKQNQFIFVGLKTDETKSVYFRRPQKTDETKSVYFRRPQGPMKKTRLVSSARLADENMTLSSSACLADEKRLIFVGCRVYFHRFFSVDGFWANFVGFRPTKLRCFLVATERGQVS
jgi:hypothetical protein